MKIVVTGSMGNISKPLTKMLVSDGHEVTVISSSPGKKTEIESIGATAAIGSLEDTQFLTDTFSGSESVYTMIPPGNYFDHSLNLGSYYERFGRNYKMAVEGANVKRVVHLSSIGAHMQKGNGILAGTYVVEQILKAMPGVSVMFIRPTSFFYNLLGYIHGIKSKGVIATNYGIKNVIPWVSPIDIADVIAEELVKLHNEGIRYVASEELTGEVTAAILGEAIGKPGLRWQKIPGEEAVQNLVAIGMNPTIAAGLVEMYTGLETGLLSEDYFRNRPAKMGKVKLEDYAREFAAIYHSGE